MATNAAQSGGSLWDERMKALAEKRDRALQDFVRQVDGARRRLASALDRLDKESERLTGMKDHRLVLVRRTPGAPRTVYHSVDDHCGWANPARSDVMLEGEARQLGLERCRACIGWYAYSAAASA